MHRMREELIKTAIDQFGHYGRDGVSTRQIAATAGTTMSMITYHFGGKEGLYRAAAEYIIAHLRENILGEFVSAAPSEDADNTERLDFVCALLRRIGKFMLTEESAPFALFIMREQQSPCSIMEEITGSKVMPVMGLLMAQVAALQPHLSGVGVRATALFLFGMAVTMRTSKQTMLGIFDVEEIDDDLRETILSRLEAVARNVLENDT